METPRKEYSENDSFDREKTASEYGNSPARMPADNSGNEDFGQSDKSGAAQTTGEGYSEIERSAKHEPDHGRQFLIDKYNINDQAHSDSSLDDFVKTTSSFKHEPDETNDNK